MDIKFHITKIIDSGSCVEDWTAFIDQLKQKKCDRDLLLQVNTIALNNIPDKRNKGYKKLLVGLANFQSESSIETARQTFINANGLDADCAVVCVYFAQFEHHHGSKREALRLLRLGKCDGRVPKILIKKAYQNIKESKCNLFDGVPDPWDESLHDITDTATITTMKKEFTSPVNTGNINTNTKSGIKTRNLGMPSRSCNSASSLLKESKPKSPTKELKEMLGLIDDNGLHMNKSDSAIFVAPLPQKVYRNEKENFDDNQDYGPSLSPFMKAQTTPLINRTKFSLTGKTPDGFMFDLYSSGAKKNATKEKLFVSQKDSADVVELNRELCKNSSIDDGYSSGKSLTKKFKLEPGESVTIDHMTETMVKKSLFTENEITVSDEPLNNKPLKPTNLSYGIIDGKVLPTLIHNDNLSKLNSCLKTNDNGLFKTPLKQLNYGQEQEALLQRTCPKKTPQLSTLVRKPLTEIKTLPKQKDMVPSLSCVHRYRKNSLNEITKEKVTPPTPSGLTELIYSIDLLKDPQSTKKTFTNSKQLHNTTLNKTLNKEITQGNITSCSRGLFKNSPDFQSAGILKEESPSQSNLHTIQSKNKIQPERLSPTEILPNSHLQSREATKVEYDNINSLVDVDTKNNSSVTQVPCPTEERRPLQILTESKDKSIITQLEPECSNENQEADMDVNKAVQNCFATLGRNGFNVGSQLQALPQRSKHFAINGKQYEQIRCIGKGGSCKVYEVKDTAGYKYALKRVKLDDLDPFMIDCHMNEIHLLTKMKNNPYVIQLFDWEKNHEHLLILMEKGDTDLNHELRTYLKVPLDKIKQYWKELLHAVQVIHKFGIVHADLKPANFLFVDSTLKLIDFGISNSLQSNKTSITRECQMGTLNYMPPEALMADISHESGASRISCASDVWSLGCMLYLMVFKQTPYQHEKNQHSKMYAIQQGHTINYKGVDDPVLLDCLQGCLKYNKRDRYTIEQLLEHPFLKS